MSFFQKKKILNSHGELIDLSTPKVMGILNITPDSFYEDSRVQSSDSIESRVKQMVSEGADFIDVGAYSSRPGSKHIDEKEEWCRLESALRTIREIYPDIIISIDTFRSEIARLAIEHFHVNIINDISAGEMDSAMMKTVGRYKVPYVMMHMKGIPQNMQIDPVYKFIIQEIITYFSFKITEAKNAGITDMILDPGFGFGKTLEHNYQLLKRFDEFKILELPILAGLSRKSMIYKLLNISPKEALNGTTVLNTIALYNGANILRVHDVKEAVQTVKLFSAM